MDQTDAIERFMNLRGNREKWNQFLATQKFPLGEIKDVPFSFDHPLVRAHFQFAKDILDILGDLNELFQMKNAFINNLWDYMASLYQFLVGELGKIETGNFSRFSYLSGMGDETLKQFIVILKYIILNLRVRFSISAFPLTREL